MTETKYILKKATPYMLRNDGKLFEIEDFHPYIYKEKYITEYQVHNILIPENGLWHDLYWTYQFSKNESTRDFIRTLLVSYFNMCNENHISNDFMKNYNLINNKFSLEKVARIVNKVSDLLDVATIIQQELDQEFLRLRTSDIWAGCCDTGIYFRISSVDFNWFNLIWEIAYANQDFYSDITIVRDKNPKKPIMVDGEKMDHYPIKDFIMLKGNPIIEKYKPNSLLADKGTIFDSIFQAGLGNLVRRYDMIKREADKIGRW